MDYFSIRGAWGHGLRFFSGKLALHALILIGLGLIPFYVLQVAIGGRTGDLPPGLFGETGVGAMRAAGGAASVVGLIGYILQTSSYFASWRVGLSRAASPGGAIGYGLLAGLLAMAVCVGLVAVGAVAAVSMGWSGAWLMAVFLILIPLAFAVAAFYTLIAALLSTGLALALVLAMIIGAVTGEVGLAATMVGGSGMIVVVLLVMSLVMLWLAARFSCATSIMADRRSFNPIAAIRLSWQLTLEDQWAIVRYLALIAVTLAIVIVGLATAAGVGAAAFAGGGAMPDAGPTAGIVAGFVVGIPLAFLAVLVPAGIYRELNRASAAAEVFA
jgi:hypothetical protein